MDTKCFLLWSENVEQIEHRAHEMSTHTAQFKKGYRHMVFTRCGEEKEFQSGVLTTAISLFSHVYKILLQLTHFKTS